MRTTELVRREWAAFRTRRRILALTTAVLVTVLLGLLLAIGLGRGSVCSDGPVEVPCPTDPIGPRDQPVSDLFFFAHRPLGENGSITVRLTSMTGIITYPPPDHDEIVPGLVPWAKAGIIIKDGLTQGSPYAALMVTGAHGVRMQHNYTHDTAGRPGGVSPQTPRWLRLTRAGDTITGDESADGTQWTKVGTARLAGLPETVQVGLFATSPGDLTLKRVALGGSITESRFTQATATFDHIGLDGAPAGPWGHDSVGEMGHTDWEKYHRAPGVVESNGTLTVTGTGDIGPVGAEGGHTTESHLVGLSLGMIIIIVLAVRFLTTEYRPGATDAPPLTGRTLAAKAIVAGAAAFLAGLIAAAIAIPAGTGILRANTITVIPVPALTELRVITGAAALLAVVAILALAVAALVRRARVAIPVTIAAVVLPYLVAALPLLPDGVAEWLLRLTPAAGFAVRQTLHEYPQVLAHYAPSAGYFPLPWWAGFAILCAYTAAALGLAVVRLRRQTAETPPQPAWR